MRPGLSEQHTNHFVSCRSRALAPLTLIVSCREGGAEVARTEQARSGGSSSSASEPSNLGNPSEPVLSGKDTRAALERIATVLHDDILQSFATCLLKAQLCERLMQLERYDLVKKELPLLQDTLSDTIDQVRALASTLKAPPSETSAL